MNRRLLYVALLVLFVIVATLTSGWVVYSEVQKHTDETTELYGEMDPRPPVFVEPPQPLSEICGNPDVWCVTVPREVSP